LPNVKSAEKRARQSVRRRDRNRRDRTRLRTAIKKVRQAQTPDAGRAAFQSVESLLDRYASKGVIHKNTAARTKARLSAHVASLAS
jgi:small subunit ribosomal protein S20